MLSLKRLAALGANTEHSACVRVAPLTHEEYCCRNGRAQYLHGFAPPQSFTIKSEENAETKVRRAYQNVLALLEQLHPA